MIAVYRIINSKNMKKQLIILLILVIAIFSCKNKSIETDTHDHENEAVKLYLTEYSEMFEVFAEADPFIVGNTSNILAHFTQLKDFKQLAEVPVTISLIVGTKGIRQTIEKPVSKGIYQFSLKPEFAGKGKIQFDIKDPNGDQKLIIRNIEVFADEHDAIHSAEEQIKTGTNQITFTKEQSWKIEFETTKPTLTQFGEVIKTTAQFLPAQKAEKIITAKTSGIIHFTSDIAEGMNITEGFNIATIAGNELAENNTSVRYLEAQNNYELQKANYERSLKLASDKIISEKDLLQIKTDYENAKVIFENLKRNFNANGQIVSTSNDGFIHNIFVKNGQFVELGQALFSVVSGSNLLLRADVPQKFAGSLDKIETASFKVPGNSKIFTLEDCQGKLLSYGKSTNLEDNYLIPVTFKLEKNFGFLAGSFADIYIKTKSEKELLIIPNSSIIEELGNYFVLVQTTPELFEKQQVKTGLTDGIYTEITQGLDSNCRVVSKGAIIVKLSAVSNTLDPHAGHVH